MDGTTTAEATRRRPSPGPRTSALASAARSVAAAVTIALLISGCTAPQETATPQPPNPPSAQVTAAPVPAPTIPVRPATPQAQTPKDPPPRFLSVAGTTINMPIVEVGVSPDGAMEIPEPFNEAGWYRFGPAPGPRSRRRHRGDRCARRHHLRHGALFPAQIP